MNIKTVALTKDEFKLFIQTIAEGFVAKDGTSIRPNKRIATVLMVQANVGMRIGDILDLKLSSFIKDGSRYRLDVHEEKTGKKREYTVPLDLYVYLVEYAAENEIRPTTKLFDIRSRVVQKHVKLTAEYLGLERISTHSFRKFYATEIYNNNGCNIELVRQLLQHCNTSITQRYIGISSKQIEDAINNHVCLVDLGGGPDGK